MGNCCLPIRFRRTSSAINPKNVTLLLVGLDKAGKTTIAKRLAGEPIDSVVPTVGFSVVTLRQKSCRVSLYDLGGGPQIRNIWHRYYADAHGVIFVVDAIATDRLDECRLVLQNLLQSDQISGKPVLLLANKQDLEGALDEIDIVDRLNLEKVVNEQKCPTLVELCSALHFSKKTDPGIDNGYRWLLRGIIRDYPSLNNRVLCDLAKQEAENKIQIMKRTRRRENVAGETIDGMDGNQNPFRPLKEILEGKKNQINGIGKFQNYLTNSNPKIPGLVDDQTEGLNERKNRIRRFLREEKVEVENDDDDDDNGDGGRSISGVEPRAKSCTSEFFVFEKFQSDEELLKDISNLPNRNSRNFLTRPKSSGARLYGIRPGKRSQRRKPLLRSNKTGPSPFTDLSRDRKPEMRKSSSQTTRISATESDLPSPTENGGSGKESETFPVDKSRNPFVVTERSTGSRENDRDFRSAPNSGKCSGNSGKATCRRHSLVGSKLTDGCSKTGKITSPRKKRGGSDSRKEFILDVMQLKI